MTRFAAAHIEGATNISSPFISVYDSQAHAERIAHHMTATNTENDYFFVVEIDTRRLGRGPVIRAANYLHLLPPELRMDPNTREIHRGEYLLQYTIPVEAIVREIHVATRPQVWGH